MSEFVLITIHSGGQLGLTLHQSSFWLSLLYRSLGCGKRTTFEVLETSKVWAFSAHSHVFLILALTCFLDTLPKTC